MLVFVAMGVLLLEVISPSATWDDFVFVFAVNVPLVFRRRFPRVCFLVIFAVGLLQMLLDVQIGLYDAGLLFALYSAVGYTEWRFGLLALAVAEMAVAVGAVTDWWGYVNRQLSAPEPSLLIRLLSALGAAALVAAAWALGERLRSARYGVLALADRAEWLEREREQQALLAAATERARIAREMHDVIAHGLSVMIVQADGAAYLAEQSPDAARRALEQISATGRESLAQMRGLLGLLRMEASTEQRAPAPQPDLADLDALVAAARESGATIEVRRSGVPRPLPDLVSLTAYRVIQEALTNARKHGGDLVDLELSYSIDGLRIVVTDSGGRAGGTLTQAVGHGLVGIRERLDAVGGELKVGPTADGFRVDAWLPLGSGGQAG